jgi:transcriptional regulator of arginine metabolism
VATDSIKQLRQQEICLIIEHRPVRTQHELATALREQGFRVTQATVSRDIADLGLRKAARDGLSIYVLPEDRPVSGGGEGAAAGERLRHLLADLPVRVMPAGPLVVVRTVPGSAHAIAAALDRVQWPEVVGSIAGDDTLFIACPDDRAQRTVMERLRRLTGGLEGRAGV